MNEIVLKGTQQFLGKKIPVIFGGFGEDQKCISDKTIAEIHRMEVKNIRARITDNIKRFKENVDFIDLKQRAYLTSTLEKEQRMGESHTLDLLLNTGYAKQSITQAEHIYLLSERGYAKLIKIMDSDTAWEIHDALMDEYFTMREEKINIKNLNPEMQMFKLIFDSVAQTQLQQQQQEKAIADTNRRLDNIGEVIALDTTSWRTDSKALIIKIAHKLGGNEYIQEVNREIYKLVNQRAGIDIEKRLTNKRRRMAEEGVCKSKRDKVNKVDIIAEDKKAKEIYMAIVKEMAIKYGVCNVAS